MAAREFGDDLREGVVVSRLRAAGCVYAEEEARLLIAAAADLPTLEALVERRKAGEPLEMILGWVEFGGMRHRVGPGVFVPRQRSMALVEAAVAAVVEAAPGRLLDLGCGCGALASVVRRRVPGLEVWAVDVDPAAVACAQTNLADLAPGQVLCGSWFDPLPASLRGSFEVIVANAPYVPSTAIALLPPEAREHEPRRALDGGPDGLDHHRVVLAQAPAWLAPGGRVLIEVAAAQVEAASALIEASGLAVAVVRDPAREATVLVGRARGLGGLRDGDRSR